MSEHPGRRLNGSWHGRRGKLRGRLGRINCRDLFFQRSKLALIVLGVLGAYFGVSHPSPGIDSRPNFRARTASFAMRVHSVPVVGTFAGHRIVHDQLEVPIAIDVFDLWISGQNVLSDTARILVEYLNDIAIDSAACVVVYDQRQGAIPPQIDEMK